MVYKICPDCIKPSYSAAINITWICPYCGLDITHLIAEENWPQATKNELEYLEI